MRNFSMKKFGTPIAAGPGWAREKEGSAVVGVPSGVRAFASRSWRWAPRSSTRLAPSRVFAFPGLVVVVSCWLPLPSGLGACVGVVGVVGVVPGWLGWVGCWGGPNCTGGCGAGVSVQVTLDTGAERVPSAEAEQGVPAGTVTLTVWPVTRVAVITRVWASAGRIEEPRPTVIAPAVNRPMNSFFLFILAASLLPHRDAGPGRGRY